MAITDQYNSKSMMSGGTDILLQKALERQIVRCEEVCITNALRLLLEREPTLDDAKRCSQVMSEPWDGSYVLKYNNIPIGIVKYIDEPEKFRVEFVPLTKAN